MIKFIFKRAARPASVLLPALLLLSACSSGIEVRSDVDPKADFSRYQTFNFFDTLGIEGGYNSPVFGEHYREAIGNEMARRGYRQTNNPDLYVNVTFRADDKVKMTAYTRPYMSGAYYGGPGGASYGSALGVGVGVSQRATKVTEASVFIDLVDNSTDRLVWQGVTVIEANDKVAQQLRDAVYTSVNMVFGQYPFTAGK